MPSTTAAPDRAVPPLPATPVNVLLIGSGGREHALARAIARSPRLARLYTTHPGNPGIDAIATPVDIPFEPRNTWRLRTFCDKNNIELVVIGPEEPLAHGWADDLAPRAAGGHRAVFGPTKAAARLEADKAYAKLMMRHAAVPTAEGRTFTDYDRARAFLESRDEPYVIKASGLAKGKGVIVPSTTDEALTALHRVMVERAFGDAGSTVVIEERLTGPEVSVLALVDGRNILSLPLCQDHKRLLDRDQGPNTGGMGAFSPVATLDQATLERVEREVIVPIIDVLRQDDIEFRGVLYTGLMLTPAGPKVLEFNTRFGDPECQVIMPRLASDAIELLHATAAGTLDQIDVQWTNDAAVCVVLAAAGYPDKPRANDVITGLDAASSLPNVYIDHAGTKLDDQARVVTNGGRILGVTATAPTLPDARALAYRAADLIHFPGMQRRTDIAAAARA